VCFVLYAALQGIKRNMVMNLLYGLSTPNVDQWAHMWGFVGKQASQPILLLSSCAVVCVLEIWLNALAGRCALFGVLLFRSFSASAVLSSILFSLLQTAS
jgi:hypothetical protein